MKIKHTTLSVVIDKANNRILMIKKLRGMQGFSDKVNGTGKDLYNFPGGKCLENESFLDCAKRETIEETGITPIGHKLVGQLQFEWPDLMIICPVFITEKWSGGIVCDGDECTAEWVDIDKIPYDNMWDDDRVWVKEMLAGKKFHYKVLTLNENKTEMVSLPIEEINL